jgi:hypothetical protein
MNKQVQNPSLLEGIIIAIFAALLVTSGILLAGLESSSGNQTPEDNPELELSGNPSLPVATLDINKLPTIIPSPTFCPRPEGWDRYVMQPGDSLEEIVKNRLANMGEVMGANCLTHPGALPGSTIYLPPRPPTLTSTLTIVPTETLFPTVTLRPCEYPADWVRYEIKPGDTLFKLGVRFRISEVDLATANCMTLGSAMFPGDIILVPETGTATPTPR